MHKYNTSTVFEKLLLINYALLKDCFFKFAKIVKLQLLKDCKNQISIIILELIYFKEMMLKSTQMIQNQMKMLLKLNLNSERIYNFYLFL